MKWRIPLVAVAMGFAIVMICGIFWENPFGTSDFFYGYPLSWFKISALGVYFLWIGFFVDMQLYSIFGLAVSYLVFTSKEKKKLLKFLTRLSPCFFILFYFVIFEVSAGGPYGNPFGTALVGALLLTALAAPIATIIYGYYRLVRTRAAEFKMGRVELKITKTLGISLIFLLLVGMVDVALAFTYQDATDSETVEELHSPFTLDTLVLNLEFTGDISSIRVNFQDLGEKVFALNVSAFAKVGVLVSSNLIDMSSELVGTDKVLNETVRVNVVSANWPWYSSINSTCDLRINPSMKTSLNIRTENGRIELNTTSNLVLDSLNLETNRGEIEANLAEDTVIAGNLSLTATTGNVAFTWNNITVPKSVFSNVQTTAKNVNLNVSQDQRLQGNTTLKANATTDEINLHITIYGIASAEIESSTKEGTISIERQIGFSGTSSLLQSSNFPSQTRLDIALRTTSGAINIYATHIP